MTNKIDTISISYKDSKVRYTIYKEDSDKILLKKEKYSSSSWISYPSTIKLKLETYKYKDYTLDHLLEEFENKFLNIIKKAYSKVDSLKKEYNINDYFVIIKSNASHSWTKITNLNFYLHSAFGTLYKDTIDYKNFSVEVKLKVNIDKTYSFTSNLKSSPSNYKNTKPMRKRIEVFSNKNIFSFKITSNFPFIKKYKKDLKQIFEENKNIIINNIDNYLTETK